MILARYISNNRPPSVRELSQNLDVAVHQIKVDWEDGLITKTVALQFFEEGVERLSTLIDVRYIRTWNELSTVIFVELQCLFLSVLMCRRVTYQTSMECEEK